MRKREEEKIFGEVWTYLNNKFNGISIHKCLGFLDEFKLFMLTELIENKEEKEDGKKRR